MTDNTPPEMRSKVGRLIAEYELGDIGDELVRRWTRNADNRWSLRELAAWFNKQLLTTVLRNQGQQPVDETVATTYRLLTDDDVSPAARTQTKRDLERLGIDVKALLDSFVSHQAIHTYLVKYRNTSPPEANPTKSTEQVNQAIKRLQSKVAVVTESNVNRLIADGNLDMDEFEVIVNVEVLCVECGDSYPIGELVAAGGCDCQ